LPIAEVVLLWLLPVVLLLLRQIAAQWAAPLFCVALPRAGRLAVRISRLPFLSLGAAPLARAWPPGTRRLGSDDRSWPH
jgi:hypothetical protein